jgi:hypothetical protein
MELAGKDKEELSSINGKERNYQSLKAVSSSQSYGVVAAILTFVLVAFVFILVFVPWQQSVSGIGKTIIFRQWSARKTLRHRSRHD